MFQLIINKVVPGDLKGQMCHITTLLLIKHEDLIYFYKYNKHFFFKNKVWPASNRQMKAKIKLAQIKL